MIKKKLSRDSVTGDQAAIKETIMNCPFLSEKDYISDRLKQLYNKIKDLFSQNDKSKFHL